jgi:hypothetical protein
MKAKLRSLIKRLVLWAVGDHLDEVHEQHRVLITTTVHASRDHLAKENAKQFRMIMDKVSAVMAIDTPFHNDAGMIVVAARMAGGRDIVKVIDLSPRMSPRELKEMVSLLERTFAARPEFVDSACMAEAEYLRGGPRRYVRTAADIARERNQRLLDPTIPRDDAFDRAVERERGGGL